MDGRLLAVYEQNGDHAFDLELRLRKTYFMGKLTHEWRPTGGDQLAVMDRRVLCRGQTALSAPLRFRTEKSVPYPDGEEQGAGTVDGKEKFATYFRDSFTGFDYARQRYYSSRAGRFLTADPYRASGGAGDPVNVGGPSGMDSILVISDELFFDGEMACTFFGDPEGVVDVTCQLAPLVFEPRKDWQTARDPRPPKPSRWCDEDDPTNKKVIQFIRSSDAAAEKLSSETGLGADFIVAWAAGESKYGKSKIVEKNNNYFNLKIPRLRPWPGQVAAGVGSVPGWASFSGTTLYESGLAALTGQDNRYLTPALQAQAAGLSAAAIAEAMAE